MPNSGQWEIVAAGAQGGGGDFSSGGLGARVSGTFTLTRGATLSILVGGAGNGFYSGGGSFVAAGMIPLAVAGGGGGAFDGSAGGAGRASHDGPGGGAVGSVNGSGGGGGWTGDGATASRIVRGVQYTYGGGGRSFANGGQGGAGDGSGGGGFGGGGGSGGAGGGGGGFTGGAGGQVFQGGSGGGSYLAPFALNPVLTAGVQAGNGFVSLELLSAIPVPAPAGLPVLAAGLLGLAALRRRG